MTLENTIHGLEEVEAKIKRLSEIIIEAKTLAGELASCEVEISSEIVE